MKLAEDGKHVKASGRTVAIYLTDEWLPRIRNAAAATTWSNWCNYAKTYVVPRIGRVKLQALTAPQLQALYDHLLSEGRVKADLSTAMYQAWTKDTKQTARQVATASGATVAAALNACRKFRQGWMPAVKSAGLEPKTVRNVHIMLHAAL